MPRQAPVTFGDAFRFWLNLGFINFGGPAGQIAIMDRELVDQRRWVAEPLFLRALNFSMLLPGPEATERVGRRTLKHRLLYLFAVAAFVALFFWHMPTFLTLWLVPLRVVYAWRGTADPLFQEMWFLTQAAFVTFGGAYAVLSYIADVAVNGYGWRWRA